MRRFGVLALAAVLIGAATAPSTADQVVPTRTVTLGYVVGAGIDCERSVGCVSFRPRVGERFVALRIRDLTQMNVYATVTPTRRGLPELYGAGDEVCGRTHGSHRVEPGQPLYVYFENHLGSWHGCPGAASRGTVSATFYR